MSNAGRLVERSELRRRIWADSWRDWETGLHQAVRKIRAVLGDSATRPEFIETVPRRGYRFVAEVEAGAAPAALPWTPRSHGWEVPFARLDPMLAPWRNDPRWHVIEQALDPS